MFRLWRVGLCLVLAAVPFVCFAQSTSDLADKFKAEMRDAEVQMLEAKQVLMDTEPDQWATDQVQTYLFYSMWVVYTGTTAYILDGHWQLPSDLRDLERDGYIHYWPQNPFNEWEPMQVKSLGDGFVPGELCLEPAPPSYRDGEVGFAFEILVYGPTVEFSEFMQPEPLELHKDWAVVPEGALFMTGLG